MSVKRLRECNLLLLHVLVLLLLHLLVLLLLRNLWCASIMNERVWISIDEWLCFKPRDLTSCRRMRECNLLVVWLAHIEWADWWLDVAVVPLLLLPVLPLGWPCGRRHHRWHMPVQGVLQPSLDLRPVARPGVGFVDGSVVCLLRIQYGFTSHFTWLYFKPHD